MRFLADECVAVRIVERLRAEGFDVVKAADICPQDEDDLILARAVDDGRVLITADKDFGELVIRLGHPARGVVSLALGDLSSSARAEITVSALRALGDRVDGNLVTIEPGRIRVRPITRPAS